MSNELIMIGTMVVDLTIVLIAFRLGRPYLLAVIIVNLMMVSLTAAKVGEVFGVAASPQSIFYASIFLGTDLLTEHYGKKAGYEAVWGGFIALAMLAFLGQVVVHFQPLAMSETFAKGVNTVFGLAPQIAAGSFLAYVVSQNFDVWFYHTLKNLAKNKHLWLRNNLSTITSQSIDTVIFFPIAFYGVLPWNTILELMAVAMTIKVIVALVDTPYVYLARQFLPADLRGRQFDNRPGQGQHE